MKPRTPLPPRRTPLARGGKPNAKNPARQKREKARTNGSPERDAFVRGLPCCACGIEGYSEVAHVGKEGKGAGIKANYDQTAPLCGPRISFRGIEPGCHRASHRGQVSFERAQWIDLQACAAETERAWRASTGET